MDTAARAAAWAKKLADLSGELLRPSIRYTPAIPPARPYPVTELTWCDGEDPVKVALDVQVGEGRPVLLFNFLGPESPYPDLEHGIQVPYELPDIHLRSDIHLWMIDAAYPLEPDTALQHQDVTVHGSDGTTLGTLDLLSCGVPLETEAFVRVYQLAAQAGAATQKEVLVIPAWPELDIAHLQAIVDAILADQAHFREVVFVNCPRPAA